MPLPLMWASFLLWTIVVLLFRKNPLDCRKRVAIFPPESMQSGFYRSIHCLAFPSTGQSTQTSRRRIQQINGKAIVTAVVVAERVDDTKASPSSTNHHNTACCLGVGRQQRRDRKQRRRCYSYRTGLPFGTQKTNERRERSLRCRHCLKTRGKKNGSITENGSSIPGNGQRERR